MEPEGYTGAGLIPSAQRPRSGDRAKAARNYILLGELKQVYSLVTYQYYNNNNRRVYKYNPNLCVTAPDVIVQYYRRSGTTPLPNRSYLHPTYIYSPRVEFSLLSSNLLLFVQYYVFSKTLLDRYRNTITALVWHPGSVSRVTTIEGTVGGCS